MPDDDSVRAALTLKTDGTRPILVREYPYPTVNGEQHMYTRDSSSKEEVIDGSTVMLGSIDLPVKPKGVEVSGTITSYGDANETVTVTLLQGTSIIGSPQMLTGVSGSAPYDQAYSFGTVPAGTYTLKVEKKGHAPFTKEITVGSSNVTENVTMYLIGDVNGDGEVDVDDVYLLLQLCFREPTTEELLLGDIDGNGEIDVDDVYACLQMCF